MEASRANRARIGVLGCGRVSARYREVFRDELTDIADVVAVTDLDRSKSESFAGDIGGSPVVADMDALFAEKPDLLCILSESGNHYEHAKKALEAGINVIVEKPVALRLEHAEELSRIARERGLICAEIKQNRYNPAMRFLRGAMDEGRFGKLVSVGIRVHWSRDQSYYDDPWHGRWRMDGGVLSQQAIHHIDAMRWLGGPIEAVCAQGRAVINKLEAEDTATAIVRFENGAMGTIEATTAARPRDFEASLHIVGDKALAKVGGRAINLVETWESIEPQAGDEDVQATFSQDVPTSYGLGHGPYIREVIDYWRAGKTDVPVSVDEGSKALAFLHALYRSMEVGGWVSLKDAPRSERLGL